MQMAGKASGYKMAGAGKSVGLSRQTLQANGQTLWAGRVNITKSQGTASGLAGAERFFAPFPACLIGFTDNLSGAAQNSYPTAFKVAEWVARR